MSAGPLAFAMNAHGARISLVALALLACVTVLTVVAFVTVSYADWGVASAILGCLSMGLVVICVRFLLDALERWLDGAESRDRDRG